MPLKVDKIETTDIANAATNENKSSFNINENSNKDIKKENLENSKSKNLELDNKKRRNLVINNPPPFKMQNKILYGPSNPSPVFESNNSFNEKKSTKLFDWELKYLKHPNNCLI